MSESLAPGSTFAGCRLEDVAGRGGMGVVFRATQLVLQRPVALKAIAPEFAADKDYRDRFQRESHLAASIDHPNVIPVYEAGELDGTLYLIMRWIDGTDLGALLKTSVRVSPLRAIRLLRPVASALAAAHKHGLVHRDVKPANVLITPSYEEYEDHIYLTDFGIARRTDGETITRTGVFVGTIDYMAPERIEGGKGDAACDIYSFGCMLFEALTGHVPFDRPTGVSKIFAHVNDPIPSARGEVDGVPELLDAIIMKAMAKRPEDRFWSAGELTATLGQALRELETAERTIAAPERQTAVSEPTGAASEPTVAASEPTRATSEPTAAATGPTSATAPPTIRIPDRAHAPPKPRRSPRLWVVPIAVLAVAGVLVAVLTSGKSHGGNAGATIKINGGGLNEGRAIRLSSTAGSISVGTRNLWISLPNRDELIRSNLITGSQQIFPAAGSPNAIVAGFAALWVAEPVFQSLAQFNGDSGAQVHVVRLPGTPATIALDGHDSSAWVADSSGAISHVALGGGVIGRPARSDPAAASLDWGEGWVWAANGANNGLVRVSLGTDGSSTAFRTGPSPIAVALDQGVWTAHANGHLTRFDPRPGQLRVNADLAVAPRLDAVAATDPSPFVWATSKSTRTLYRVTNTSNPTVTGTVVFGSPPVALAVNANSVWVATQAAEVIQIRF